MDIYTLFIYPLLIFLARMIDVPFGTLRIIFLAKGKKLLVPILGFFEVLLWLIVITKIVQNVDKPHYYLAYALGFAAGNWMGMLIDQKLAVGTVLVRIITAKPALSLVNLLRETGYVVTDVPAFGATGQVNVIFTIVKRKEVDNIVTKIREYNPQAFYTIEDIGFASKNTALAERKNTLRRFFLAPRK
ncbi:DUF2179 domain-containing protein [candidate division KSB1 bacterium]|nr:DUF2179 domain-containing protein [candidate division KSB1 bacterium]RQW00295.1 MAG: DUF2179 domain-containing protein [candidate division KSB1 bacterium]